jgi:hypothetical protein
MICGHRITDCYDYINRSLWAFCAKNAYKDLNFKLLFGEQPTKLFAGVRLFLPISHKSRWLACEKITEFLKYIQLLKLQTLRNINSSLQHSFRQGVGTRRFTNITNITNLKSKFCVIYLSLLSLQFWTQTMYRIWQRNYFSLKRDTIYNKNTHNAIIFKTNFLRPTQLG